LPSCTDAEKTLHYLKLWVCFVIMLLSFKLYSKYPNHNYHCHWNKFMEHTNHNYHCHWNKTTGSKNRYTK
jgi:hypothetical protein